MTDLSRRRSIRAMNLAVDHQTATDPRADRGVEQAPRILSATKARFRECGHVAVIA